MKSLYQWHIFMFFILLLCAACNKVVHSASNTGSDGSSTSSLLTTDYEGYRLELVNIEVIDKNVVRGTLINTGKYKVQLPPKKSTPLVINFDESLSHQGLDKHKNPLQQAILQQSLSLEPGQIYSNFSANLEEDIQTNSEEVFASKGGDFQDYCPDLKIDTFFVSKRTRKYAEITFKIVNIGKGPAPLYGPTNDKEDNVAIRAYASGTENLSRGDLILGGYFIEKGLKKQQGILQPLESFESNFRIDIRKKTRHMPYLIISVDDYQTLWECEEGNNVKQLLYR